jgi:hypothetical protein
MPVKQTGCSDKADLVGRAVLAECFEIRRQIGHGGVSVFGVRLDTGRLVQQASVSKKFTLTDPRPDQVIRVDVYVNVNLSKIFDLCALVLICA